MRLAADAKVLLSAVTGGRARLLLLNPDAELFTTEHTMDEVQEYAEGLARKRRLPIEIVMLAVAALPVKVFDRSRYERKLSEARRRIAHRDPDDVDLVALALQLDLAIWSNDKDFAVAGMKLFTTAQLLRELGPL